MEPEATALKAFADPIRLRLLTLIARLSDKKANVRAEAAQSLGRMAEGLADRKELESAIEPLRKAAGGSNEGVRRFAADSLKAIVGK